MQAELEEALLLQDEWTSDNTAAMQRRGVLVRQVIPQWLRQQLPELTSTAVMGDLAVEGRDGTGRKTEIPWTRVYSANRSPSATQGWYVVYLFSAFGDRVYVSLNQGTTRWEGGEFRPRAGEELAARVAWARNILGITEANELTFGISLEARRSKLGHQYELGNVAAIEYPLDSIPDNAALASDLRRMIDWLRQIYEAEETSLTIPGEPAAEIADALLSIRQAAGSGRRTGQGFRLNTAEKLAIEKRAVEVVTKHYEDLAYSVEDVGTTRPFDLDVKRGDIHLSVEVKGTTSVGTEVILTSGEVNHHRERCPNNSLAIVHSIELNRSADAPLATGGELHIISPWEIEDSDLIPMAFKYQTGLT